MNGNLMYEMARQRLAEQRRTARQSAGASEQRAAARGRRGRLGRSARPEEALLPAIPDYAHELLAATRARAAAKPRQQTRP